jgi:hypothetical protein
MQRMGLISPKSDGWEGILSFRVVRSAEASWQGAVPDGSGRIALGSFNITRIELRTVGDVPGVDHAFFRDIATKAKACTVSRALTGTEITLEASVASG